MTIPALYQYYTNTFQKLVDFTPLDW